MSANVRVVDFGGDSVPDSAVLTVRDAARVSQRALLVALRDKIAGDIDEGVAPRDLASLSLRLLEITGQIGELDQADEPDDVTDAAATPDESW